MGYASKDWRHGKGRTPKPATKGCKIERIAIAESNREMRWAR